MRVTYFASFRPWRRTVTHHRNQPLRFSAGASTCPDRHSSAQARPSSPWPLPRPWPRAAAGAVAAAARTPATPSPSVSTPTRPPSGYDPQLYSAGQFQFFSSMYDALFVTDTKGEVVPSLVDEVPEQPGQHAADADPQGRRHLHRRLEARLDAGQGRTSTAAARTTRPADLRHTSARAARTEITDVAAPDPKTVVITWAKPQARGADRAGRRGRRHRRRQGQSPTRRPWRPTPDGSGPVHPERGQDHAGSSYTVDKNDKAWNADAFVLQDDRLQGDHRPAGAGQRGRLRAGRRRRCARLHHCRPGQVQAERRQAPAARSSASRSSTRPVPPTRPSPTRTCGWRSSYGIDREAIVKDLHPASRPTAQLFPKGSPGFDAALDNEFGYDPAKAKQLLAARRLPEPARSTITVLGQPTEDQIAVQDQWKKIGVDAELQDRHLHRPVLRRRAPPSRSAFGPVRASDSSRPASSPVSSSAAS